MAFIGSALCGIFAVAFIFALFESIFDTVNKIHKTHSKVEKLYAKAFRSKTKKEGKNDKTRS